LGKRYLDIKLDDPPIKPNVWKKATYSFANDINLNIDGGVENSTHIV
jgi:hypothetical protein